MKANDKKSNPMSARIETNSSSAGAQRHSRNQKLSATDPKRNDRWDPAVKDPRRQRPEPQDPKTDGPFDQQQGSDDNESGDYGLWSDDNAR